MERGFVYRGLKPVYWCFDCASSLAEFEIEYARQAKPDAGRDLPRRRSSPAGRRLWPAPAEQRRLHRSSGPPPPGPSPANQALERQPRAGATALVDTRARPADRGLGPGRKVPGALEARRQGARHRPGQPARPHALQAPAGARGQGLPPHLARVPGRLRHRRRRHRHRALAPRPTAWTTSTPAWPTAWTTRTSSTPCRATASTQPSCPCSAAMHIWKAVPVILEALREAGRLLATTDHHPQLPALLAPQNARDLPRRRPVVRAHGRRRRRVHHPTKGRTRPCARPPWKPSSTPASTPKTARPACAT